MESSSLCRLPIEFNQLPPGLRIDVNENARRPSRNTLPDRISGPREQQAARSCSRGYPNLTDRTLGSAGRLSHTQRT